VFAGGLQRYAQIQDKGDMNYYYVLNGQQAGPVAEAELRALVAAGTIGQQTLVWREGMPDWQSFATVFGGSGGSAAIVECSVCHKTFPEDQVLHYGTSTVCAGCKPQFLQSLRENAPLGGTVLASIGARFWAKFLDGIILGIFQQGFAFAVRGSLMTMAPTSAPNWRALMFQTGMLTGFNLVVGLLYQGCFLKWRGQTPGKMAAKIKVVTPDGGPLSWGKALSRPLAEFLSGCACWIGYLMAIWDPEKRTLHDRMVGTRVIKVQKK
jgi:uncharacterized RDD family membrane protein YckC